MSSSLCNGDGVSRSRSVSARHGREIDRLDVDAVAEQQFVAGGFAKDRVADQHRDDVARRRHYRQACLYHAALQRRRALLVRSRSTWLTFRWRIAASAPAASAGGSEVVKMNPGAWLRRKSTSASEPAM